MKYKLCLSAGSLRPPWQQRTVCSNRGRPRDQSRPHHPVTNLGFQVHIGRKIFAATYASPLPILLWASTRAVPSKAIRNGPDVP